MKFAPGTLLPRARHSSVSDGKRFIYVLGSKYGKALNSVERFDHDNKKWEILPSLIKGGINLTCLYFKSG